MIVLWFCFPIIFARAADDNRYNRYIVVKALVKFELW